MKSFLKFVNDEKTNGAGGGDNSPSPQPSPAGRGGIIGRWLVLLPLLVAAGLMGGSRANGQQAKYISVNFTNLGWPTAYYSTYSYTNNGTNWFFVPGGNQGQPAIGAPGISSSNNWQSTYYAPNSNALVMYIGDKWLPSTPVDVQMGVTAPNVNGTTTNGYFTNYLTVSPDGQYWYPSNYLALGGLTTSNGVTTFDFWLPQLTNIEYVAWDGMFTSCTNPVTVNWFRYHVMHPSY